MKKEERILSMIGVFGCLILANTSTSINYICFYIAFAIYFLIRYLYFKFN
jgi:hypothetical protein